MASPRGTHNPGVFGRLRHAPQRAKLDTMQRLFVLALLVSMISCARFQHRCAGHLPETSDAAASDIARRFAVMLLGSSLPYDWRDGFATSPDGAFRVESRETDAPGAPNHHVFDMVVIELDSGAARQLFSIHETVMAAGPTIRARWSDDSRAIRFKGSTLAYGAGEPERIDFDIFYTLDDGRFYDLGSFESDSGSIGPA
jgi:hypothetical protein